MADFLNFDAIQAEIITIQRNGKKYDLRDDVPFETLIQALPLLDQFANLGETFEGIDLSGDGIDETLEPLKAKSTHLCGEIFRHSLPAVTDEEIARQFSLMQRVQIIRLFFSRIGSEYKTLPNATAPEPTPAVTAKSSSVATSKRKR